MAKKYLDIFVKRRSIFILQCILA